jgi:putative Holliday junction resolvase
LTGPVLAVDPGDKRLGLAASDPGRTVARPLKIIRHSSRAEDAAAIADEADRLGATLILIGLALDQDGATGPQARKAMRLADEVRSRTSVAIETWDESGSTLEAAALGKTDRHLDDRAAAVLLQDFLNARRA